MIGGPFERNLGCDQPAQSVCQLLSGRIKNCQVIETGNPGWWGRTASAFPCVQSNMMMITACGEECGLASVPLRKFKTKHITIEPQRPIKIGNLQMDVSNPHLWVKRAKASIWFHKSTLAYGQISAR